MRVIKLTLAYDGTAYVGWQRQPNGRSVQALVEDALAPIEGGPVTVAGAGRTDAGVHALGQVASVELAATLEPATLARALNATLPADVRVLEAAEAPPGFHARFSAAGKTYRYQIRQARVVSPFEHRYVWHHPRALDVAAMARAADALVGRHDFAAFQAAGSDVATTVRTVTAARVEARPAGAPPDAGVAPGRRDRGRRLPAPHGPDDRRDARRGRGRPAGPRRDGRARRGGRPEPGRADGARARPDPGAGRVPEGPGRRPGPPEPRGPGSETRASRGFTLWRKVIYSRSGAGVAGGPVVPCNRLLRLCIIAS